MTTRGVCDPGSREESNDAIVSRLAQHDKILWYKKPNLRLLYLFMVPTCLGVEITGGIDASMLNGLQAVPSWLEYYHHPHSTLLGLMSAMYPLGSITALPFVPFIVDKVGRRYSIIIGSVFMIIGGALQGSALNLIMFIIARFMLGFGIAFAVVSACSLVGELAHPKERAIVGSFFSLSYFVGTLIAAAVTLSTFAIPNDWAWRIPSFLQLLPSLFQISFIWFLPESPRWLVSKGRGDEAHAILVKYHAEGDENSEFVEAEYSQIESTLTEELKNSKMGWSEILSTPGMRKRVFVAAFISVFSMWSGWGLISYFLAPVLDTIGIRDNRSKNLFNLVKCVWELTNGTIIACIASRFPRRTIFLTSTISLFVVFVAWTAASAQYARTQSLSSSRLALFVIFLHGPAYNLAFNALYCTFMVELFPFHMRARGVALALWFSRGAGFVGQFVDPIGIHAAGWKYYIVYCVWIAFEVVFVYFMLPETSGRTLEELARLYEDDHVREAPRNGELEPLLHRGRNTTC